VRFGRVGPVEVPQQVSHAGGPFGLRKFLGAHLLRVCLHALGEREGLRREGRAPDVERQPLLDLLRPGAESLA
jgi:hypothetical protein